MFLEEIKNPTLKKFLNEYDSLMLTLEEYINENILKKDIEKIKIELKSELIKNYEIRNVDIEIDKFIKVIKEEEIVQHEVYTFMLFFNKICFNLKLEIKNKNNVNLFKLKEIYIIENKNNKDFELNISSNITKIIEKSNPEEYIKLYIDYNHKKIALDGYLGVKNKYIVDNNLNMYFSKNFDNIDYYLRKKEKYLLKESIDLFELSFDKSYFTTYLKNDLNTIILNLDSFINIKKENNNKIKKVNN